MAANRELSQLGDQLVVDANGNIGIGTTSPTRKLVVYDDNVPYFALQNSSSGTAAGDGLQVQLAGLHGYVFNYESGDLYLGAGGATRITAKSDGKVGIGTTSPSYKFQVEGGNVSFNNGTADTVLNLETDSGGTYDVRFNMGSGQNDIANEGHQIWYNNSTGDTHFNNTWTGGKIRFHTATQTDKVAPGTNERMTIDENGCITKPYQPGFRAVLQNDWNSINSSSQKVTGFAIAGYGAYQVGNNFSSDRFTAPVTGQYYFSITSLFSQSQGYWSRLYFYKNGNNVAEFLRGDSYSSDWHEVAGNALIYLNAGDYVEIYANAEAGANYVYNSYTQWHGVLLG